jgi:hypothetical protein
MNVDASLRTAPLNIKFALARAVVRSALRRWLSWFETALTRLLTMRITGRNVT